MRRSGTTQAHCPRPRGFWARCTLAVSLCAALPTAALQPLITDDAETQGRRGNQLEIEFDREHERGAGAHSIERSLSVVYTRGLTDTLDAYVGWSNVRLRSNSPDEGGVGSGNPALGLKWRLWEDPAARLSLALRPEVQLAVSRQDERRGLGNGGTGYALIVIASRATGFGAVHVNLAAQRVDYALDENRAANRRMVYRFSVAPVFQLSRSWMVAIDAGLTTNPDRARRARMGYAELAAIWMPRDNVELALGVTEQLGEGEPQSRTLSMGLTWQF
jgi:hypothetical protein